MAAVGGVNNETYFGNCESVTDHGLDRGPRYADRALLGRSGPVQNRSGLAGPRFLDRTVATLGHAELMLTGSQWPIVRTTASLWLIIFLGGAANAFAWAHCICGCCCQWLCIGPLF